MFMLLLFAVDRYAARAIGWYARFVRNSCHVWPFQLSMNWFAVSGLNRVKLQQKKQKKNALAKIANNNK